MADEDFYAVLGVGPQATPKEIKKSYYKLARQLHPDKNNGDELKVNKFKLVENAYSVLSDEDSRKEYDLIKGHTQPNMPSSTPSYETDEEEEYEEEERYSSKASKDQDEVNKAVMKGDIKALERFLAQGIKLESEFYNHRTMSRNHGPLYYAIREQQVETIKWLLDHNVNINDEPHVFLNLALDANNLEIVNLLFDKGIKVDVNASQFGIIRGNSALVHICGSLSEDNNFNKFDINARYDSNARTEQCLKTVDMARIMLAHGAKVNQIVNMMTSLQHAIRKHNVPLVKFLIENGANINMSPNPKKLFSSGLVASYSSPLEYAAFLACCDDGYPSGDVNKNLRSQKLEILNTLLEAMTAKKNDPLTPKSLKLAIEVCESMEKRYPTTARDIKKYLEDYLNANYSYSILSGYQVKTPTKPMVIQHIPGKAREGTISLAEAQEKAKTNKEQQPTATQQQKAPPQKPGPRPPQKPEIPPRPTGSKNKKPH